MHVQEDLLSKWPWFESSACDTSGVSTFKYNQGTLVKVKRKMWELIQREGGSNKSRSIQKKLKEKEKGVKSYSKL